MATNPYITVVINHERRKRFGDYVVMRRTVALKGGRILNRMWIITTIQEVSKPK